jgi:hypothetical protein
MNWLAQRCLDRPGLTLGVALVLTIAIGTGMLRLEFRTDGDALLPDQHPVVLEDAEDRDRFRDPREILLVVNSREGAASLATPAGFRFIAALHASLRKLEVLQPSRLLSLAGMQRAARGPAGVVLGGYLDQIPDHPREFAALLAELREREITDGLLLSTDGRRALFSLPLSETASVARAVQRLEDFVVENGSAEYELLLGGPLLAETTLGDQVLRDLAVLVPLMLLVIMLLLFAMMRSPAGIAIPMIETLLVLIWTLGAMGWAGAPIALVTTILPVVLMAMCIADEIHLLERLVAVTNPGHMRARVEKALGEVGRPIILTSLTTALGFLSFLSASIGPLRDFGLFAAFGILVAMGLTFSVIPALIVWLPERAFALSSPRGPGLGLVWMGNFAARRPVACFGLAALFVGLCVAGVPGLRVSDAWVDNFDTEADLVRSERAINESFWGSYRFDVVLEAEPEFFRTPDGIALVEAIQEEVRSAPHVGGVESDLSVLRQLADLFDEQGLLSEISPGKLWDLFTLAEFSEDRAGLDRLLTSAADATRIRLYVQSPDYARERELRAYLDRVAAPLAERAGVGIHYSGDLPLASALVESIVHNQLQSIGWALGTVGLLLVAFSRRLSSLLAIVPVIVTVAALFGLMGYFDLRLGIATSMFASLAVGVGVDFGIHFQHRFERERQAGGNYAAAIQATFQTVGNALFWNASVLSAGFAVLIASSLKPNHSLGVLLVASTLGCYMGCMMLLPMLLRGRKRGLAAVFLAVGVSFSMTPTPAHAEVDIKDCKMAADPVATKQMLGLERARRGVARIQRLDVATRYEGGESRLAQMAADISNKTLWSLVDGNIKETWMIFVFSGPGRMSGTSLLIRDFIGSTKRDETWFYLRAFNNFERLSGAIERTVVPSTALSYEDARGYIASAKYSFRFAKESKSAPRILACPRSEALAGRLGYGALLIDFDSDHQVVRRIDYYGLGGALLKRYLVLETTKLGKHHYPAAADLYEPTSARRNRIAYEYWLPAEPLDREPFRPSIEAGSFRDRIQKALHKNGLGERIDAELRAADEVVRIYDEKWRKR